jgi:membrane-bound ClpP family serine protease
MDIFIVIILCLLGLILVLIEIFLIPGITITAVLGGLFAVGGVYYAFDSLGNTGGMITLITVLITFGTAFVYLIKSRALDRIALQTNIDSTVASEKPLDIAVGDEGIAISRLNPIGKVKVNGITMEGKSLGDFIDECSEIVVIKVNPTQLIVKTNF